jgi:hypothetical protein
VLVIVLWEMGWTYLHDVGEFEFGELAYKVPLVAGFYPIYLE